MTILLTITSKLWGNVLIELSLSIVKYLSASPRPVS